jgi:hypothetical protein
MARLRRPPSGIATWRVVMAVCRLAGMHMTMFGALVALATRFTFIAFFFFHDLSTRPPSCGSPPQGVEML